MSLTLVLGPANAAKAGEVLVAYRHAADSGALLVVPTLADAEHYDRELTAAGGMLGRTLTFPRLLDQIALRVGFEGRRITPLQRARLLRAVIADLELPSLRESAASAGFSRAAGRLLASVGRARASAPRFAAALSAWAAAQPARHQYARDLAAICLRYAAALDSRAQLDAEGFAWGALDLLRSHPERWRSTPVYVYGFDDLTEIELDAITTLAGRVGAHVTVSLTFEPDRPALAARAGVVEDLRAVADVVRPLPALDTYYEPGSRRALHHLERHLFEPGAPVLDPGEAVVLLESGGEWAEAEQVGEQVAAALADGVAAAEIAVVCRSLQRSGSLLERALARRGIQTASERRLALSHTSLGRALIALARCALRPAQASAGDLLAYLRAPGVVSDRAALDAFAARIARAGLTELDEVRALGGPAVVAEEAIVALRGAADPALGLAAATRELLAAPHRRAAALLDEAGRVDARAGAVVLDALPQVSAIDREPEQLLGLLAELELRATDPAAADAVLVSEPLSIRARRFRRVIITGLCEGEFPNSSQLAGGDPFLSEDDRRELALASGLSLGADGDPMARERYLLYACVSRATERVTLSYRSADEDGNLVAASPFLDDLSAVLGADWYARRRRRALGDDPALAGASAQSASEDRERGTGGARDGAVYGGGFYGGAVYGGEFYGGEARGGEVRILGAVARDHVRHTQVVSGNALETFADCPVRWLIERQLQADDLRPGAEPLAKGSFVHRVLERVIDDLGGPLTTTSLPRAQAALSDQLAKTAAEVDFAPGMRAELKSAVLRGIEADLRRYLEHEASAANGWPAAHLELRFGMSDDGPPALALGDSLLRGVIDRVDVEPGGRRAIVRDYKSGRLQSAWAAQHWQEGHKLQVGLYMLAARRLLGLEPVAGFYQPLTGPDLRPRGVHVSGVEVDNCAAANDELSETELAQLLEDVEQQAIELADRLRQGELSPCPSTCSVGGGCKYPGICWAPS